MRSGKRAYMTGTRQDQRPTGANDDAHPNNSESQLHQLLIARGEPESCFTLIIPAPRDRTVLALARVLARADHTYSLCTSTDVLIRPHTVCIFLSTLTLYLYLYLHLHLYSVEY
jgi:hypothetical protein